jgi:hypothetical protein
MIYERKRVYSSSPGTFYRLQREGSGKSLFGFSHGTGFVQLSDKEGTEWRGQSTPNDMQGGHSYRFQNDKGETLTGISDGQTLMLRDARGRTWKGIID